MRTRASTAAALAEAIKARRAALLHERYSGRGANWLNKLRSGADGSASQGLSWFFGTVTLREPTYEDVVVAYVLKADDGRHGLSLRAFRNVPAADLEMCLPSLHPFALAPSDRVTLRLSAIFAASVGAFSYHQLGHPAAGGWTVGYIAAALTALSTFGAYTTRTLLRWRNSSLWTHQLVTTHMVEKAYARGDAVLAQCAFDAHAQVRTRGRSGALCRPTCCLRALRGLDPPAHKRLLSLPNALLPVRLHAFHSTHANRCPALRDYPSRTQEVGVAALLLGALHLRGGQSASPVPEAKLKEEAHHLLAEALRRHHSEDEDAVKLGMVDGGIEKTAPLPDFDAGIQWLLREDAMEHVACAASEGQAAVPGPDEAQTAVAGEGGADKLLLRLPCGSK